MQIWSLIIIVPLLIILSIACINMLISVRHSILRVGQQAPDFTLIDDQGKQWRLADHLGTKMVIYFYPKDFTAGCTKEACDLRDNAHIYEQHNIKVVGISYDSPESHHKFKEEHHLPFTLLSDTNKTVAKQYGAYRSILSLWAPARITYLLDEQGKIIAVFEKVNIRQHAEKILETFAQQKK
jgi:peroxiredoxin Q/BCP